MTPKVLNLLINKWNDVAIYAFVLNPTECQFNLQMFMLLFIVFSLFILISVSGIFGRCFAAALLED